METTSVVIGGLSALRPACGSRVPGTPAATYIGYLTSRRARDGTLRPPVYCRRLLDSPNIGVAVNWRLSRVGLLPAPGGGPAGMRCAHVGTGHGASGHGSAGQCAAGTAGGRPRRYTAAGQGQGGAGAAGLSPAASASTTAMPRTRAGITPTPSITGPGRDVPRPPAIHNTATRVRAWSLAEKLRPASCRSFSGRRGHHQPVDAAPSMWCQSCRAWCIRSSGRGHPSLGWSSAADCVQGARQPGLRPSSAASDRAVQRSLTLQASSRSARLPSEHMRPHLHGHGHRRLADPHHTISFRIILSGGPAGSRQLYIAPEERGLGQAGTVPRDAPWPWTAAAFDRCECLATLSAAVSAAAEMADQAVVSARAGGAPCQQPVTSGLTRRRGPPRRPGRVIRPRRCRLSSSSSAVSLPARQTAVAALAPGSSSGAGP